MAPGITDECFQHFVSVLEDKLFFQLMYGVAKS